ncbi:di-trans,poly-cis-decaprenylcistransferase [Candidatus Bathyarchaeota archaeon]|nr:di-trans,poly-cis-decaprenylcistransferase [Candidatus Bathyarchaeota archaeon]
MLSKLLKLLGIYKLYEKWLFNQVKSKSIPSHVGVILDGNRRWASKKDLPIETGYLIGAGKGEEFLDWCLQLGITTVTVYAFSTENFQRPKVEVEAVLKTIEKEILKLEKDSRIYIHKIKVKALGRIELLPETLKESLKRIEEATRNHGEHYLNIAIAYGGRIEIVDAAKKITEKVLRKEISIEDINEDLFMKYLYTAHLPNPYPDLVIRTSGEERLSGFLLWQSAYSELSFLDVYWPEFRKIDFLRAIRLYQQRKRRFGK